MQQFIVILIVSALGCYGCTAYKASRVTQPVAQAEAESIAPSAPLTAARFKCDGRTYCSQMTSCEEAKFFLKNCPGVKMDGNRDGTPCELQWCKK